MKRIICALLLIGLAKAFPGVEKAPKIIGGQDANPDSAPFMVSLQLDRPNNGSFRHLCGATILSSTWTVTAAHCIAKNGFQSSYRVVAGQIDFANAGNNQQIRRVSNIVVHENFNLALGHFPFDIVLLELETPLNIVTGAVQAAQLPEQNAISSGNVESFGWGSISGQTVILPDVLQMVSKPIIELEICREIVNSKSNRPLISNLQICTGPLTGGVGPCEQDAGGPIVQTDSNNNVRIFELIFTFYSY